MTKRAKAYTPNNNEHAIPCELCHGLNVTQQGGDEASISRHKLHFKGGMFNGILRIPLVCS